MSVSTRASSAENLFLIGQPYSQILGSKLPSIKQVLSVLFFNNRTLKLNIRDSAALVFDKVAVFWNKAHIPIQAKKHAVDKIMKLHEKWLGVFKSSTRKSEAQTAKEQAFVATFNDLFDIASADALDKIKNEEDKQFLLMQRQKGRPGAMIGIDAVSVQMEKRRLQRLQEEVERRERSDAQTVVANTTVQMDTSSSEISSIGDANPPNVMSTATDTEEDLQSEPQPTPSTSRGKTEFINERVAAALDKCKISDRDAIHVIIAVVEALGLDTNELIINRSSLRRMRQKYRETTAAKLKENYKLNDSEPCVVHFDGKILPDISGKNKVDRLPVIVSNKNGDQLLGVPRIQFHGKEICSAVLNIISDWGLLNNVQAISCDTTASNTGRINGACTLLQQEIGRSLMLLPCRHHIFELVLKAVFDLKMGSTSAPVVLIFKRFQSKWGEVEFKNVLHMKY